VSPEADNLYGLPLERFVAERTALVRALRADGRRQAATAVAGARKPSLAAWAVNQLVRTQAGVVKDLFAAGDELRRAQSELLAGRGDRPSLRAAGERERAAVDRLLKAARGLLTAEGHELSGTVVDRVADTLHAAALDPDAREAVGAGCLERELRHVGLGDMATALPAAPARGRAKRAPKTGAPRPAESKRAAANEAAAKRAAANKAAPRRATRKAPAEAGRETAAGRRAEAKRRELERAAAGKAAAAAEAAARRRAEAAARALETAQARREQAVGALARADEAVAAARAKAEAAAGAHRSARAALERIGRPGRASAPRDLGSDSR
jgi:hypothetical protein